MTRENETSLARLVDRQSKRMQELMEQRDALLDVAKEGHGWDDPLHMWAYPECPSCAAIAKAERKS